MLVDTQRRLLRVCFGAEPVEADLASLGGPRERWLLYRHMVRNRLDGMTRTALRRTVEALGEARWRRDFDAWLAAAPPRSRYIRDIVPSLLAFAAPRWAADPAVPAWLPDLAALEGTRWEVASMDAPQLDAGALAFDREAVIAPALRLLDVGHAVHRPPGEDGTYAAGPTTLCVARGSDDRTSVWPLSDFAAALLVGFLEGGRTITEVVRDVAAAQGIGVDQALAQRVGSLLGDFFERGVLLGAR